MTLAKTPGCLGFQFKLAGLANIGALGKTKQMLSIQRLISAAD
ncbi:hypothetical protein ACFONL_09510 [Camelimonas fluminis]|uniref:Uncharacterized protein n=1 Tax=Camelimonas fluminis TaxID=1576911 RepID=A0ABV7UGD8_9HYPH|nr:hypothetical protein [Camelimonas fluminis]